MLLSTQGDHAAFPTSASVSSIEFVVQRLCSAKHAGERLQRHPGDIILRLLRGQRAPCGLVCETKHPTLGILRLYLSRM